MFRQHLQADTATVDGADCTQLKLHREEHQVRPAKQTASVGAGECGISRVVPPKFLRLAGP